MLKVACLVKQVPLPSEMRMGADGLMDRTTARSMINHDCSFALEQALELKDQLGDGNAHLTVVSMGPPSFEATLRKAITCGFDRACLLSDRRLGGSDTYATGLALATFLTELGFNRGAADPFLVVAGRQTSDGDTAHVPSQVAESLRIPQATFVQEMRIAGGRLHARRIVEGGEQLLSLPFPCLVAIAPTGQPLRRPSMRGVMRGKAASIETWNLDAIGLSPELVGLDGSPTIVAKTVEMPRARTGALSFSGDADEMVRGLVRSLDSRREGA